MERVQRYDLKSGEVTGRRRTSTGGIVADARVTRTGVLSYRMPDGSTRREYRPPEEVFAPESLATLAHATLTDDHPGKVTPANWRRNTIGHVADGVKRDGKFVSAELHLQHDEAIDKADTGELSECSCGYDCAFDPTPGKSPDGEAYDGVQRNIRYNHVALGPPGWGRAGAQVRMRLDGGEVVGVDASTGVSGLDEWLGGERQDSGPYVRGMKTAEELQKELDAANEKVRMADEKARADSKTVTDRLDALEKTNKTLVAENELFKSRESKFSEDAKKQADAAVAHATAAKFDAAVEEQVGLRADGHRFLGAKWSHKGKTPDQVRKEVIARVEPEYAADKKRFDSLSGDALVHVYGLVVERADKVDGEWDHVQDVISGARNDAKGGEEEMGGAESDCDAMSEQKKMVDRKKDGAKNRRDRERKAADARGAR